MYFENIILNLILCLILLLISSLLNLYLNKHARLLSKYSSKCKLNSEEIVNKYAKDENIELYSYVSKGNNDLDNYSFKNKCLFLSSRYYFSPSIYTLARTLYFCSMSKVDFKKTKFQNISDTVFTLLDVLNSGLILIGLLIKSNLLIIIGLSLLFLSFIFALINLKVIKSFINYSLEYLKKINYDKKEIKVIEVIYLFETYQYLCRPLLALTKLFPFLLSSNQKKMKDEKKHYE